MNLSQIIKRYWVTMLAVIGMFFCIGFFISKTITSFNDDYYSVRIISDNITQEDIDVDFFYEGIVGKKIYSKSKIVAFFENKDIKVKENSNGLTISIKKEYFESQNDNTEADSHERFVKVVSFSALNADGNVKVREVNQTRNLYINGLITASFGLVIFVSVMLFIRKKLTAPSDEIYSSGKIFRFPFSKAYWKSAFDEVRDLKIFDMCLISILFALQIIMKFIDLPSGFGALGLGLTFLIFAYISLIYGPIWGIIIGFGSDIIGFLIHPSKFHPGYTLQAMLTGFTYGLCFYKTDLRFSKTLTSRIIVNVLLNGIFGAFLWGDYTGLSSQGISAVYLYMITIALPKNIIYLFPQVILLYFFLKTTIPLLIRKKIVPKEVLPRKKF